MANSRETITRNDYDLYFKGSITVFENGDKSLDRSIINYEINQPEQYHTVIDGDTITRIAWQFYKNFTPNPTRYWKYIADANEILNPLDLSEYVGREIVIPNYNLIRLAE